jgi:hypothetical protein
MAAAAATGQNAGNAASGGNGDNGGNGGNGDPLVTGSSVDFTDDSSGMRTPSTSEELTNDGSQAVSVPQSAEVRRRLAGARGRAANMASDAREAILFGTERHRISLTQRGRRLCKAFSITMK